MNIEKILDIIPTPEICTDHQIELLEQLDYSINDLYIHTGNKELYNLRIDLSFIKKKLKEIR